MGANLGFLMVWADEHWSRKNFMKPYPFALSPFLTFKTFLALNSLICRHLANKCSDRFPESAVSVKRTTPTVVSKSMPRSAQILSGMIIVASCVVVPLPAAAKECSRVKVEGLGSDPSEEGPFTQAAREQIGRGSGRGRGSGSVEISGVAGAVKKKK